MTPEQEIERLRGQVAELEGKVSQLRSGNGALMVDADRRERRAAEAALSCTEHGRELQYLRHCVSWYWDSMNVSDQARMAIVSANLLTAKGLREGHWGEQVDAAEVAEWLEKNADAQKRPLKGRAYPTLADCIRAGGCDHDGLSDDVKRDIAEALGLAVPA